MGPFIDRHIGITPNAPVVVETCGKIQIPCVSEKGR